MKINEKWSLVPCLNGRICTKGSDCYRWLVKEEDLIHPRMNLIYTCRTSNYSMFTNVEGREIREIVEELPENIEVNGDESECAKTKNIETEKSQ